MMPHEPVTIVGLAEAKTSHGSISDQDVLPKKLE